MVYWGCGTTRNKWTWGCFLLSAVTGSLLIIAGAKKLDLCSRLPVQVHIAGACSTGPTAMTVIGVFVLLGMIPCLLFFSGCARGPPQTKYPTEGVPTSGVTVVRNTANGPQVFQYDSNGQLVAAPDCTKHTKHSEQYVLPVSSPVKSPAGLVPLNTKKQPPTPGLDSSPNSPRQPTRARIYSSDSGETATAEVHVSVVGPLAASRAAQIQQQLAQLAAQAQIEQQSLQDQQQHRRAIPDQLQKQQQQ